MSLKKVLSLAIIATSLFTCSVFAANIGTATTAVNVRETASTSSNVLTTISQGTTVEITGLNNGFYSINRNGKTSFVSADFIKISKADGNITADGVYIRKEPNTTSSTAGLLGLNTPVTVVGQTGDWYQIQDGSNLAYINKNYVKGPFVANVGAPISAPSTSAKSTVSTYSGYYKINADGGLNLRSGAAETSNKIGVVPNGTVVSGLDTVNGFTKINYNGTVGYVKASFIVPTSAPSASSATTLSANTGSTGANIVAWAKQYIGTPYKYGGTSLTSGVDCSGFVYSVFKQNPYYNTTLNRVAADQYSNGTKVSKSELQPGDIVVFDTSVGSSGGKTGSINHSGIYAGNGQFIHSSSGSAYGITVSDLNSSFYSNSYIGATRVIK